MIYVVHDHPYLRFPAKRVRHVLHRVYTGEGKKKLPSLSIVFTGSKKMQIINRKYVFHDYETDIVTFPLDDEFSEVAEMYINLDIARRHASEYHASFHNEVQRLLIHGALHLLGYTDKTKAQQEKIHSREDYYLSQINS